jgi:hypothetical protein
LPIWNCCLKRGARAKAFLDPFSRWRTRRLLRAVHRRAQLRNLPWLQLAVLHFRQRTKIKRPQLDAFHLLDWMLHGEKRLPQQIIRRIIHLGFEPRVLGLRLRGPGSAQPPHPYLRATPNLLQSIIVQPPGHFHPVNLWHARRNLKNAIRKYAVGRQQNQSRRRIVQPPHGKHAAGKSAQQMSNRSSPLGIGHRRNHMRRLVQ